MHPKILTEMTVSVVEGVDNSSRVLISRPNTSMLLDFLLQFKVPASKVHFKVLFSFCYSILQLSSTGSLILKI